jgi:hypothetical protein
MTWPVRLYQGWVWFLFDKETRRLGLFSWGFQVDKQPLQAKGDPLAHGTPQNRRGHVRFCLYRTSKWLQ